MANSHPNKKRRSSRSFFLSFLPNRSDGAKDIIFKVIFIISFLTMIFSASYLTYYFVTASQQNSIIEETRLVWEDPQKPAKDKFDLLREQNSDFVGWIKACADAIDNPVYQAEDDEYYLTHNQYGAESRYGAVYLSCEDDVSEKSKDKNLVVYGHNMRDGSMFGTLKKLKNLSFYKSNPSITFETENGSIEYVIFSVFLLNASPEDDNGYIYNYTRSHFADQSDFDEWRDEALERSIISTGVTAQYNDDIITLLTCSSDFNDARLVVMARKLNDGESALDLAANAAVNRYTRYPKRWYDDRGQKFPY